MNNMSRSGYSRKSSAVIRFAWLSNTHLAWRDQMSGIVVLDTQTNTTSVPLITTMLFGGKPRLPLPIFTSNHTYILDQIGYQRVWRHSFTARYNFSNWKTGETHKIRTKDGEEVLQFCNLVERGENRLILIYVSGNNIYWREDPTEEDAAADIQITNDGVKDVVFNGIPDWVYEEEVLMTNIAHYINDEANKIAYVQFDDSQVPEFKYPHYGDPENIHQFKYPHYKVIRYPKVGATNPTAKLFVFSLFDLKTKEVIPPPEVEQWSENIFIFAEWTMDGQLRVTWHNRVQNESVLALCAEVHHAWQCTAIFVETQPNGWLIPNGWRIDKKYYKPLLFHGDYFLNILPSLQSDTGRHYRHIAKIDALNRTQPMFLTKGSWIVDNIISWNTTTGEVKFSGTENGKPWSRHIYTVLDDGRQEITCITCLTKTSLGDFCEAHGIRIKADHSMYVQICELQGDEDIVLKRMADHSIVWRIKTAKKRSEVLRNIYTTVGLPEAFTALVHIQLPEDFDENKKYPVVVTAYGAPAFQAVAAEKKYGDAEALIYGSGVDWDADKYSLEIIEVKIDGRGSNGQSDEHMYTVYKRLGTVSVEDQLEVTRQLIRKYKFMDKDRVGIWGWSYGGYMTTMVLGLDSGPDSVFKCGVAVAPGTHWLLYDTIYTERYMGLYHENKLGYNHSVFTRLDNLRHKKFLLQMGVGDDNVHFQHSALLIRGLQLAGIKFKQMLYPDEVHSIFNMDWMVYDMIGKFWDDCFKIDKK